MMEIKEIKRSKLKMILQFSIPSIIAMLLETAITITDGYFTGNYVGDHALAAINLGLPILYFYLGSGLCVGVGGSVISGRLLGAKKEKKASEVFSQTMVTAILVCGIISLAVFVLFTPILGILRADGVLSDYFTAYYRIMLFTYPLMVLGTISGMFIRVDGKPQICMFVSIIGCSLNVILDYMFVGIMGFGVSGSAVASLIVQFITVVIQLCYFITPKAVIRFRRFAFNYVLMKYVGAEGVAAFTILGFVVYGYSMVCIGFGQGIAPLVSVCWGAKETEAAMDIRKITNCIMAVCGIWIAAVFFIMGKRYAGMFGCSSSVAEMVASGFRLYAATFLVMGYDVINSMYFTSCGDAKSSALISSLRGIVLLLAFILILPALLGMTGVWLAAPCTEILTAAVSLLLVYRQKKKIKYPAVS